MSQKNKSVEFIISADDADCFLSRVLPVGGRNVDISWS